MSGQIHRHKKKKNFTMLDNTASHDNSLSWKAKGLHTYLMTLPDDWKINITDLTNRSKDGRDGTAAAIKELLAAGYLTRTQVLDEKHRFSGYDYHIFETPENQNVSIAISENGKAENGKSNTNNNYKEKVLKEVSTENIYIAPKKIETIDEAETLIKAWINEGNIETVKIWYSTAKKHYDRSEFLIQLTKFCSNYLNTSDMGRSLKFKTDPVLFFRNGFRSWLLTSDSFTRNQSQTNQPKQEVYKPLSNVIG